MDEAEDLISGGGPGAEPRMSATNSLNVLSILSYHLEKGGIRVPEQLSSLTVIKLKWHSLHCQELTAVYTWRMVLFCFPVGLPSLLHISGSTTPGAKLSNNPWKERAEVILPGSLSASSLETQHISPQRGTF